MLETQAPSHRAFSIHDVQKTDTTDNSHNPKMIAQTELLIFADDWGRHPSSCQHLVRQLLPKYEVTWVNTIGMRPPRLNVDTFKRGMEKLRHWRHAEPAPDGAENLSPRVLNPRMWPWNSSRFDRALNRRLLVKQINRALNANCARIAITTLPLAADLVDELHVDKWIYYCVDDFTVWPGLDHRALDSMERDLITKSNAIVAASVKLQERVHQLGGSATLLTHGVDVAHWQNQANYPLPEVMESLDAPLIIFWGLIDQRMDLKFVEHLADSLDFGTILFVGPTDNPSAALFEMPRVKHLPAMTLEELAAIGQRADVLIMPYVDEEVTRAMQPLKMLEYLATGKPVVARDLPAAQAWADCLDLATNERDFSLQVMKALEQGLSESHSLNRRRLIAESWQSKASYLDALISDLSKPESQLFSTLPSNAQTE